MELGFDTDNASSSFVRPVADGGTTPTGHGAPSDALLDKLLGRPGNGAAGRSGPL